MRRAAAASRLLRRCVHDRKVQPKLANAVMSARSIDWDDRVRLQESWSNAEKGWLLDVEWQETPFGAGAFAMQDITPGTILRQGIPGVNMMRFQSAAELRAFCQRDPSMVSYISDYLYGFDPDGNEGGPWHGIWVPGNGLNHSPKPNTIYRVAAAAAGKEASADGGINLHAMTSIRAGDELVDDYRRFGRAPAWAIEFAEEHSIPLVFAECNDFVK